MLAVGIAESDMNAGELLVLQNIADHPLHAQVGADGELAHAVGVFVGVRIGPEILFELLIHARTADDPVARDLDGQRRCRQQPVACAEPVAHHTINHKCAVHVAWGSKTLASG